MCQHIGGQMLSVATETWTSCIAGEHKICCYDNKNGEPFYFDVLCVTVTVRDFSYSHMPICRADARFSKRSSGTW